MKKLSIVFLGALASFTMAISPALASGDVLRGEKLAKKCVACHTLDQGGKNKLGPNLFDILGKQAGNVSGYKYSKAMVASDVIWDEANFNEFVRKPKKLIKGTKMSFRGLKKATQRADLLAYFKTLRIDTSLPLVTGNADDGRQVATRFCVVCHSFEKGGKVVYGPNLFDIVGKPAGAIAGYQYSAALKNSGLVWNDRNLIGFLADPEGFVEGTKARFPGLKSARQKADILAYLKTLK